MLSVSSTPHVFRAGEDGITCAECPLPWPNQIHRPDTPASPLEVVRDATLSPYARLAYLLYVGGERGTDAEIARQLGVVPAVARACRAELAAAGYLA